MTRLLRAELRKVFTTRLWWGMLLGALTFTALEVVGGVVVLIYGVAATVVALAIAIPWLNAKGITLNWAGNDLGLVILAAIAVVTIYAIVGLGIGCLIRNQIAAVIASLVYLLVIESIIGDN